MKILKFLAENVLKLHVVEIDANGEPVILGGPNGAGKSAVLRSIIMALGGKTEIPDEPVRDGARQSKIVLQLGDGQGELTVTRKTNAETGRTTLVVERDGARLNEPQGFLSQLVGPLTFDPCAFKAARPAKQFEMLSELVGLDFTTLNTERAKRYSQRTTIGREVARLKAELESHPFHDNVPEEEISVAELSRQLEAAIESHRVVERCEAHYSLLDGQIATQKREREASVEEESGAEQRFLDGAVERGRAHDARVALFVREFAAEEDRLRREYTEERARVEREQRELDETIERLCAGYDPAVNALNDAREAEIDPQPIREQITSAEGINKKVRENAARIHHEHVLLQEESVAAELTEEIESIDASKRKQLEETQFPVEGLSLREGEVVFGGHPLNQASDAEQLRVSVAMALAMNPKLRILLVPAGEKLDNTSLALVAKMAADADTQLWLERHMVDDSTTVVIEEGRVVETEDGGVIESIEA
jgi:ABC-type ATPase involved in cell division